MTDLKYWQCDVCSKIFPYLENKYKHSYRILIHFDSMDIVGGVDEIEYKDVCVPCSLKFTTFLKSIQTRGEL